MTDKAGYPQAAFGGDTVRTVTLTPQDAGDALANLVRDALIFANWAAGEGFCPEGIPAPEDFLTEYSDSAGDEDWETFSDRISAAIRALSMPAPAQAWRVKPLEWEDADEGMCTKYRAPALGGHYCLIVLDKEDGLFSVNLDIGGLCFRFILNDPNKWGERGPRKFPTIEAAKAAAQADYAARILAALIPDTEGV